MIEVAELDLWILEGRFSMPPSMAELEAEIKLALWALNESLVKIILLSESSCC